MSTPEREAHGQDASARKRLLLLCTTTGYQAKAFVEAAQQLSLDVVFGTDRCHVLEDPWQDGALPLRFEKPREAARRILAHTRTNPLDAIVALGDRPTPTAAYACRELRLPYHPPEAAEICRDKYKSRQRLAAAGLRVPRFVRFTVADDPKRIAPDVEYPCVLKPLAFSASRGVIRADDAADFITAFRRICRLLCSPDIQVLREETSHFIQVENFISGCEFALEGLLVRGELKVLALFDKPDALEGPYFEETMYVTPSRLPSAAQAQIVDAIRAGVEALGLYHGPIHAEVRLNAEGVWILEVAARPIGGLCARALRFEGEISLEELVLRHALGQDIRTIERERGASGVMMIPIPAAGVYEGVEGLEDALPTPGILEIRITVKPEHKILPLPEGASYLGFIFARGATPEVVEHALRAAHQKLRFQISPLLPVV